MILGVYGFITRLRDVKNALDTLKTLLHVTAVPQDIDGESRRADSRYCLVSTSSRPTLTLTAL